MLLRAQPALKARPRKQNLGGEELGEDTRVCTAVLCATQGPPRAGTLQQPSGDAGGGGGDAGAFQSSPIVASPWELQTRAGKDDAWDFFWKESSWLPALPPTSGAFGGFVGNSAKLHPSCCFVLHQNVSIAKLSKLEAQDGGKAGREEPREGPDSSELTSRA